MANTMKSIYTKTDTNMALNPDGELQRFEKLTEEEKRLVQEKATQLDYHDTSSIILFGAEDANELSEFSSNLLKGFKTDSFSEIEEPLKTLNQSLREVDTETLQDVKTSNPLYNLPFIGTSLKKGAVEKVNSIILKHKDLERVVDDVAERLEKTMYATQKDLALVKEMAEKTYRHSKALKINYMAIMKTIDNAKAEIDEVTSMYDEGDLEGVNRIADLQDAVVSLERRAHAIMSYMLMNWQNLQKLKYIKNSSEGLIQKIDNIKIQVLPIWKQQFSFAVLAYHNKMAALVIENTDKATREIYLNSNTMVHDAMVYSKEQVENTPISLEDFKAVNQQMIDTFSQLKEIEEKAREARKAAIPEYEKLIKEIINFEVKK